MLPRSLGHLRNAAGRGGSWEMQSKMLAGCSAEELIMTNAVSLLGALGLTKPCFETERREKEKNLIPQNIFLTSEPGLSSGLIARCIQ